MTDRKSNPARQRSRPARSAVPDLHQRSAGVLLHPTSLPGPHGLGDLGRAAHDFAGWLAGAGQGWWQMLPVGPPGYGDSPYSAHSAFAGSPLLVAPEELVELGLLDPAQLQRDPLPEGRADYGVAAERRQGFLVDAHLAFAKLPREAPLRRAHAAFCRGAQGWLEDYALYAALKHQNARKPWWEWPEAQRLRAPRELAAQRKALAAQLDFERFVQFLFARQWAALRQRCAELGVALLGDLPIFVARDSADVWAHPELFLLDERREPTVVAGVPPDYFSSIGQRWGNPLYDWPALKRTGYAWWVERLRLALERFDAVRLDHFIGFQRYWAIPADEPTAVNGRWRPGPGAALFRAVLRKLGKLPLVAEDLGAVTPEVTALREQFDLPGLKLLQFAFGTDPQGPTFLPHSYARNSVAYTGTHDNDTTAGWFHDQGGGHSTRSPEQCEAERRTALAYLGSPGREIHWEMLREVHRSVANLAIAPAQDLLGLGTEARMNRPGSSQGNWAWRLLPGQLSAEVQARLGDITRTYGRARPIRG